MCQDRRGQLRWAQAGAASGCLHRHVHGTGGQTCCHPKELQTREFRSGSITSPNLPCQSESLPAGEFTTRRPRAETPCFAARKRHGDCRNTFVHKHLQTTLRGSSLSTPGGTFGNREALGLRARGGLCRACRFYRTKRREGPGSLPVPSWWMRVQISLFCRAAALSRSLATTISNSAEQSIRRRH